MEVSTFGIVLTALFCGSHGFLADGNGLTLEERLLRVESDLSVVRKELLTVQSCSSEFCEVHWSSWSAWSAWTPCTGQCSASPGLKTHEQTRIRTRQCNIQDPVLQGIQCLGDTSQSEKRPCNAVELYGCLNSNTNYSNNQFSYVYNFFDELAQSACVAAVRTASHVSAVRRNCNSGKAPQCSQICANLHSTCFDELHVYQPSKTLSGNIADNEGERGLMMYRYFSCTYPDGGCGPNFCCCKH
ncbi:hypothetical protein ACF0H5_022421 [Mactra antiquata]